jgi:hypothetical protein
MKSERKNKKKAIEKVQIDKETANTADKITQNNDENTKTIYPHSQDKNETKESQLQGGMYRGRVLALEKVINETGTNGIQDYISKFEKV